MEENLKNHQANWSLNQGPK